MSNIRVYHAFRSPYSRLGLHVIERAALEVELIPFTGPPSGVPFSDPLANAPKLAYYGVDAPRMTTRMGLRMRMPKPFEVDFTAANKALVGAGRDGAALSFAIAVSDARWGKGENVSDINVLEACAEKAGWSVDGVKAAQEDGEILAEMERHRQMVEEDGVFGVPFAIRASAKYWGHDRFNLLVEDAAG